MNPTAARCQKMEKAIYAKMSEEEKKQYIADRKEQSRAKYQKRIDKSNAFRAQVQEGRNYAKLNNVPFVNGGFGRHLITAAVLLKTDKEQAQENGSDVYYQVGYTIKSLKDTDSRKIRRGISAYRVLHPDQSEYTFTIKLARRGAVSGVWLASLIMAHIEMDIITKRVNGPRKLWENIVNQKCDRAFYYWEKK